MVLTITVVGNGQNNGSGSGHAVLSPNDLAQLMSGQAVTGLLNPDGSITLNSNVMQAQQITSMPTTIHNNGGTQIASSAGSTNYQLSTNPSNSITNIQAISGGDATVSNQSQTTTTTQKKTGQKRLTAKQKLAQQQQQQQQVQQQQQQQQQQKQMQQIQQPPDGRTIMTNQPDQPISQQPQIVATVQLPNGQIGQLIAPSGGQFWSPNAINLQQLSMAVAAATGSMPQTMSIPANSMPQPGSQMSGQGVQQQSMQQSPNQLQQQGSQQQQQQQSSQSLNNSAQQQVVTSMQQPGQMIGRQNLNQQNQNQNQNQIWSGGQISLSQLSALAQQGVVQISPVQGIPASGPNGQRVMEMIPQAAIQGLLNQNGQPMQAIPLSNGGQYITQDPNDPNKWQIVPQAQIQNQQSHLQSASATSSGNSESPSLSRSGGGGANGSSIGTSYNTFVSPSQNTVLGDSSQPTQPQRKLKRLACTCPNCRDGDNNRTNGDKKKQHICHFPDCNKVYGKTSHLRAHLRWHSGERPYVCNWSFCGKKFTRSDELQRHRRTHTGEKRFQCPECLKRFMRSDHLSKHLKTHLSSKKSGSSQQQADGMPTVVTLSQTSIKMEDDMIDEMVLDSQVDTIKQESDLDAMATRLDVNSSS